MPPSVKAAIRFGPYPAHIFGRIEERIGYMLLQSSLRQEEEDPKLLAELRSLAIDWWGASVLGDAFQSATGHFRSTAAPGNYHLFQALGIPGKRQPSRAIVTIPAEEYAAFGFNPYTAIKAGLFDFAQPFLRRPATGVCSPSSGTQVTGADLPAPDFGEGHVDRAADIVSSLQAGESLMIPARSWSFSHDRLFEFITWCLPPEVRSKITICSFAFAQMESLLERLPIVVTYFDPKADRWELPRAATAAHADSATHLEGLRQELRDRSIRKSRAQESPLSDTGATPLALVPVSRAALLDDAIEQCLRATTESTNRAQALADLARDLASSVSAQPPVAAGFDWAEALRRGSLPAGAAPSGVVLRWASTRQGIELQFNSHGWTLVGPEDCPWQHATEESLSGTRIALNFSEGVPRCIPIHFTQADSSLTASAHAVALDHPGAPERLYGLIDPKLQGTAST